MYGYRQSFCSTSSICESVLRRTYLFIYSQLYINKISEAQYLDIGLHLFFTDKEAIKNNQKNTADYRVLFALIFRVYFRLS